MLTDTARIIAASLTLAAAMLIGTVAAANPNAPAPGAEAMTPAAAVVARSVDAARSEVATPAEVVAAEGGESASVDAEGMSQEEPGRSFDLDFDLDGDAVFGG